MIILHAAFLTDHLCLWGEKPIPTNLPIAPKSTRKTRGQETPQPLPFDPGPSGLMSELALAGLRPASPKGKTESKIIWQPTLDGKPTASSPLIAELPDQEEQVKKSVIQPWTVTVLPLPMEREVKDPSCPRWSPSTERPP